LFEVWFEKVQVKIKLLAQKTGNLVGEYHFRFTHIGAILQQGNGGMWLTHIIRDLKVMYPGEIWQPNRIRELGY
jgi:hypothetical protein